MENELTVIWVWPSEEGVPPRAQLIQPFVGAQTTVTWSRDSGLWLFPDGTPVDGETADTITEHAKELGVEW